MKNGIIAFIFIMGFSLFTSAQSTIDQEIDMGQVVAENQGQTLKMGHIVTYFKFSIENGILSDKASQEDINQFFQEVVLAFNLAPAQTITMIEQIEQNNSTIPTQEHDQSDCQSAASPHAFSIEQKCKALIPNNKLVFHSTEAKRVRQLLSGTTASRRSLSTNPTRRIQFCSDGRFTWSSGVSANAKGSNRSGMNHGNDVTVGHWDVCTVQGHTILYMYSPQFVSEIGTALAPMFILNIGSDHLSIANENEDSGKDIYRLNSGTTQCSVQ